MDAISNWLVVFPLAGLSVVAASVCTWLFCRKKTTTTEQLLRDARLDIARLQERLTHVAQDVIDLKGRCKELELENVKLSTEATQLKTTLDGQQELAAEKTLFLNKAKEQLSDTFATLANEILDRKSTRLDALNEEHLKPLLDPLKDKLGDFRDTVTNLNRDAGKERSVLADQVKRLIELNQELSDDAQNLTLALKGSSKTQGNWGELILERTLEISGLEKGREYELRPTRYYENGHRGQPDAIINLPEARHLIIDAKVSLTDYEEYVNATNNTEAEAAIRRHVESTYRHVKELSDKEYYELTGLNSLDIVVMFVPLESALVAATRADKTLLENALRKRVLLVSPTSLSVVLRAVDLLWRREEQVRNVQEIVNRGGELYNKLAGFVETLDGVGACIKEAQEEFEKAYRQLKTGPGSAIRQAEMLRELGVRPKKSLPRGMVEEAMQETLPEMAAFADSGTSSRDVEASTLDSLTDEDIPF